MTPALIIAAAWLLFAISHLYMSGSDLRERLSARISKNQYTALFALVTVGTVLVLIVTVARYGDQGWRGPNLGQLPIARVSLGAVSLAGVTLLIAGLINFPKSPMAVLAAKNGDDFQNGESLKRPTLVERITRHPFFMGTAILMAAHMLLANTLAGFVHFGGYVAFALIGVWRQDVKLRKRWKIIYAKFEEQTPVVPLAKAIGKDAKANLTEWRPLWIAFLIAVFLVWGLHGQWKTWNGSGFLVFILAFGSVGVSVAMVMNRTKRAGPH